MDKERHISWRLDPKWNNRLLEKKEVMETKLCYLCHKVFPLEQMSLSYGRPISRCKKCVAALTRIYYHKNREKALANVQSWCERHREKSGSYKKKWVLAHKDWRTKYQREYNESYPHKKKLEIWLSEIGEPILKATSPKVCSVCGMESPRRDIYIFKEQFFCWQCLEDFKQTSLIPRKKFVLEKVHCPKCGREHPDKRFKNVCVDCRVAAKRKHYEQGGALAGMFTN